MGSAGQRAAQLWQLEEGVVSGSGFLLSCVNFTNTMCDKRDIVVTHACTARLVGVDPQFHTPSTLHRHSCTDLRAPPAARAPGGRLHTRTSRSVGLGERRSDPIPVSHGSQLQGMFRAPCWSARELRSSSVEVQPELPTAICELDCRDFMYHSFSASYALHITCKHPYRPRGR